MLSLLDTLWMPEPHNVTILSGSPKEGSGIVKKFSGSTAKENPLKKFSPNRKEWISVSEWLATLLIWKSANNYTAENDQNICNREGLWSPFRNSRPRKLYRVPLLLVCAVYDVLDTADISSNFKMSEPHGLCSVCPLPLSVPETAMGVTLNAQQHSDLEYVQAIHRWEMGVCWGEHCVLLLAILIYWQGMRNPAAVQAAGTLRFASSQQCNESHSDTNSPNPSNNQFTTPSWTAVLHVPCTRVL